MKKSININLGNRIFYIEEDAFVVLEKYLEEIKTKFGSYSDSEEIILDIEARMAEHFDQNKNKDVAVVITLSDVEHLINVMGKVDQFESGEETEQIRVEIKKRGRLFRNPDNMVIAGVAGGIASYFNWDPIWVRIAFFLSVFLGGYTIILYVILWIMIPIAKTESDRLEMNGDTFTLASLEKNIKDKVNEVEIKNITNKVSGSTNRVLHGGMAILKQIFGKLIKFFGLFLMIIATLSLILLTFVFIVAFVTSDNSYYVQFPVKEFLGSLQYYLIIIADYVVAFIPLLFVYFLGRRLFDKTRTIFGYLSVSLIVIWFVAIATIGVIILQNIPRYESFVASHPILALQSEVHNVEQFNKIEVSDDINLKIVSGSSTVSSLATEADRKNLKVGVSEGKLRISRNMDVVRETCWFCNYREIEVVVQVDNLEEIIIKNGAKVKINEYSGSDLNLSVNGGSYVNGNLNFTNLHLNANDGSYVALKGQVDNLFMIATDGSSLNLEKLITESAAVKAFDGSSVELHVTKNLKIDEDYSSNISHVGGAEIID